VINKSYVIKLSSHFPNTSAIKTDRHDYWLNLTSQRWVCVQITTSWCLDSQTPTSNPVRGLHWLVCSCCPGFSLSIKSGSHGIAVKLLNVMTNTNNPHNFVEVMRVIWVLINSFFFLISLVLFSVFKIMKW
jgi:hypothetical protein